MDAFPALFLVVSFPKIGTSPIQSRATAGVAGTTYIFCLPGWPGACKDAWDEILVHQLDYRYGPCNFVEIMPRLDEHLRRPKGGTQPGRVGTGEPPGLRANFRICHGLACYRACMGSAGGEHDDPPPADFDATDRLRDRRHSLNGRRFGRKTALR